MDVCIPGSVEETILTLPSSLLTSYIFDRQQSSDHYLVDICLIHIHIPTSGAPCKTLIPQFCRQPHRFQLLPLWRE